MTLEFDSKFSRGAQPKENTELIQIERLYSAIVLDILL